MSAPTRDPFTLTTAHGGGRRPGKPAVVDLAELVKWNLRQVSARRAYAHRLRWVEEHDRREVFADMAEDAL